jgi:hypothetical protein
MKYHSSAKDGQIPWLVSPGRSTIPFKCFFFLQTRSWFWYSTDSNVTNIFCLYSAFLLSLSTAPLLSRDTPTNAGYLWDKAACSVRQYKKHPICDWQIYWQRVLSCVLPSTSRTQITPGARTCTYSYFLCVCVLISHTGYLEFKPGNQK